MRQSSFLFKYKLHHLVSWVLVLAAWYFLRYEDYSTRALAFKVTLVKVIDLAIMIYISNYVFVPRLLYKKKYGWFIIAFILMVVSGSLLKMNLLGWLLNNPQLFSLADNLKGRIYDNILPHFFLVTAGTSLKLINDYGKLQQRMADIAREKAEAELNFLKSQINPHFLFNSINAVYFLIDKSNNEARNALGKFSDMLRYQLYEINDDRIPIEKEIRYLNDYVDMQKLRKDHHYAVTFNYSPLVKGFSIEPLLLIPFVENAFKHISHFKDKVNLIIIEMVLADKELSFTVVNSKEVKVENIEPHKGIGLKNVQRRLELLYPGKHRLHITDNDGFFKIDLKIKFNLSVCTSIV